MVDPVLLPQKSPQDPGGPHVKDRQRIAQILHLVIGLVNDLRHFRHRQIKIIHGIQDHLPVIGGKEIAAFFAAALQRHLDHRPLQRALPPAFKCFV